MDRTDINFLYLYTLTTLIRDNHESLRYNAIIERDTLRVFKLQVKDLIKAIKDLLSIFSTWRSGKPRIQIVQRTKITLEVYYEEVFQGFEFTIREELITRLRRESNNLERTINQLLDCFVIY